MNRVRSKPLVYLGIVFMLVGAAMASVLSFGPHVRLSGLAVFLFGLILTLWGSARARRMKKSR